MPAAAYQRTSERIEIQVTVTLEDFRTGFFYNGTIYNYSNDGLYLESHYAPRPGRQIRLKVGGAHNIFKLQSYMAVIRWRRYLNNGSSDYAFGIGIQYC
jgi:hypothetical protein